MGEIFPRIREPKGIFPMQLDNLFRTIRDFHHDLYWGMVDRFGLIAETQSDWLVFGLADLSLAIEGISAARWNAQETGRSFRSCLAETADEIREWYA